VVFKAIKNNEKTLKSVLEYLQQLNCFCLLSKSRFNQNGNVLFLFFDLLKNFQRKFFKTICSIM